MADAAGLDAEENLAGPKRRIGNGFRSQVLGGSEGSQNDGLHKVFSSADQAVAQAVGVDAANGAQVLRGWRGSDGKRIGRLKGEARALGDAVLGAPWVARHEFRALPAQ